MPYIKNKSYQDMPFCPDAPLNDFYTYSNIDELVIKCKMQKDEMTRCRTIGILQSINGRFFLTDIELKNASDLEPLVQVSMVYLKTPPPSTVIPYPVQVFGTLQWKSRPVVFAKMLQVLSVPNAIRLKKALNGVTSIHLARNIPEEHIEDAL